MEVRESDERPRHPLACHPPWCGTEKAKRNFVRRNLHDREDGAEETDEEGEASMNRILRGAAPFVVPFVVQAIFVLGIGTFWPSAWAWMNELATTTSVLLSMAVILGLSLVAGVFLLVAAFGRRGIVGAILYVPVMTMALSNWTAYLALSV
jgi:hypothetical protein